MNLRTHPVHRVREITDHKVGKLKIQKADDPEKKKNKNKYSSSYCYHCF